MLDETQAVRVANDLHPKLQREVERLTWLDKWYRWDQKDVQLPRKATREHKALAELAKTPWLWLVVTTLAQAMFVDGYRSSGSKDNAPQWTTWLANGFPARQIALHRAALAYGYSFTVVTPGLSVDGSPQSVIRGMSPRRLFAAYEDPAVDDFPEYALRSDPGQGYRLYDDELVHRLRMGESGRLEHVGFEIHGSEVCPVVRYAADLDLEGRATGQVEPYIGVAKRINKTAYDRLLVQHFNSWKIRTVSGMAEPEEGPEQAAAEKLRLRQDDILIAEDPDTKFGTLDETPLDGFVAAWESDIEALAAVSQTPTHSLTGNMANLAAEAIVAARFPFTQKVFEICTAFGESHNRTMRLSALQEGDVAGAADVTVHATWQDLEVRSLGQAVDAFGKAAKLLGVPPRALWSRIPGVTKTDTDEWSAMVTADDPVDRYLRENFGPAPADAGLGGV
jgi:hypothetical protein